MFKAIRALIAGKRSAEFQEHVAEGALIASDADQDSAKGKYSDAASKYVESANSYGTAAALEPSHSGTDMEPKVREAQALEQFMIGRSFLDLGRDAEREQKDASRAYFNAFGYFDAMLNDVKQMSNATETLLRRAAEAEILSQYAAGMGHFDLGRQADRRELASRGGSFRQAVGWFNEMFANGSDPTGVIGLLPIQKSELLIKRSIAKGESHLGDGAAAAAEAAAASARAAATATGEYIKSAGKEGSQNPAITGGFQDQAAACTLAKAAFNEAVTVHQAVTLHEGGTDKDPLDALLKAAKSGVKLTEELGAELDRWVKIGAELGAPERPLTNCQEVLALCKREINDWGRGHEAVGTEGEGRTFAENAGHWQARAERVRDAGLLLKGMLDLAYFPPALRADARRYVAEGESTLGLLSEYAENEKTWAKFAEERGAGRNLAELKQWYKDPMRPVSPTDSELPAPDEMPPAKGLGADTVALPTIRPPSPLRPDVPVIEAAKSLTEKKVSVASLLPPLPADATQSATVGAAFGRPRPQKLVVIADPPVADPHRTPPGRTLLSR